MDQKKEGLGAASVEAQNANGLDAKVSQPGAEAQAGPKWEAADEIEVTFFPNEYARTLSTEVLTLAVLRDKILQTSAPTKAALPLLKLAAFGSVRTDKNCLRHDDNVLTISGVEIDYDGEQVSFDEAREKLATAGILALIYTSPSHTEAAPRWRVLLPASRNDLAREERRALAARANGALGGICAAESFALSQSYYFGSIAGAPDHRAEIVDGDFIDLRGDLDAGAVGNDKPETTTISDEAVFDTPRTGEIDAEVEAVLAELAVIGTRSTRFAHAAKLAVEKGMTAADFEAACREHPDGPAGKYLIKRSDLHKQITKIWAPHAAEWAWAAQQVSQLLASDAAKRVAAAAKAAAAKRAKAKPTATAAGKSATTVFNPWVPVIVPPFPLDVLPPAIVEFVLSQSEVIGCDPAGLAMACLVNFSAAIDHRHKLKMMRHGDWYASSSLWAVLVGSPSAKKTPIFRAAFQELHHIQNALRKDFEDRQLAAPDPKPPPAKRYIIQDTTIESCAEILARNPHGLLLERDELSGWIGQMDKYGGASHGASTDRAFWLKAYDGGPHLVDRIKRGEIYVPNLSISVIGGIQPARLAELQGLTSDGLLQRFIPTIIRPSRLPKDVPTDGPFGDYAILTKKLLQAQPGQPLVLDDEALLCLEDLRQRLHDIEQESDGVAEGFQAFVGKLAGVAGSLALILHMASDGGPVVPFNIADKVCKLMTEFILPHGLEFYRSAQATTEGDRLQRLASYILTSGKERFVASDFTYNVAGFRGLSVFDLNRRVSPLVAGGWLSPADPRDIANRAWLLAPAVRQQFAAQAAIEEKRKAAIAALMGSPRKAQ